MTFVPANAGIAQLKPYQPGKPISELERELGITNIVKLASNENPLGCSEQVKKAVAAELTEIGRYPDGGGFILKDQIEKTFGIAHNRITLGNGSNDLLEIFARAFVSEQDSVVYSQHAFAVYGLVTQAIGAQAIEVPAKGFAHDLDAMAAAVQDNTKLIFIANPNNPTGTWFEESEFEAFMQKIPRHIPVVLDEAYVEYFPENFNSLPFLTLYPNLIISRTLSKCYGLAALRVGFALSSVAITDFLNRIRQPFNVNHLAMVAAVAALKDDAFIARSRLVNKQGMAQLEAGFQALGLEFVPSRANFILVNVQTDAVQTFNALLQEGVIVRPVGIANHLRVSIGTEAENAKFLTALAKVLGLEAKA
ncbi:MULTISPECIES: histidinol-phosphate transaminase [unclassified Acinetobacter]|uniref:histidinol-phosphate transaminase n=1 Tax=unclassified Acinetobacter TaxID=196816 RepID=UPI0029342DED|nr:MULTISPECIES: histidinol-phosphate transaminase [unclassified Acinetobacter]WOE32369.1 histidinol-phosphate transaminase [Acinetobacter sp. SAAs470]WOE37842.1 histidinol-phosphate transaminase [Acinetobacter sp. SAAs474]